MNDTILNALADAATARRAKTKVGARPASRVAPPTKSSTRHDKFRCLMSVFTLATLLATTAPALAGDGTWSSTTTGDWNTPGNWSLGSVPNGINDVATFGVDGVTNITLSQSTQVNGIVFQAPSSAYTISVATSSFALTVGTLGITNNSGVVQNFVAGVDGAGNFSTIVIIGATAGTNTAFTASGGTVSGGGGGLIEFFNSATAGSGSFTNNGGTASSATGGSTNFFNSSSAGSGTFTNNGGLATLAVGGETIFDGGSTAGTATITTNGSATASAFGGFTIFNSGATAFSGTFITNGGAVAGGTTEFNNATTASAGQFTTNGGTGGSGGGGLTVFNNTSTASAGHFTTNGATAVGATGGETQFNNTSTASAGIFITNGGLASGANGGTTQFNNTSTAESGNFTTNGSAVSGGLGGITQFNASATAGSGTFTTNGSAAGGSAGETQFNTNSTAGTATFINNGGLAGSANGGSTQFFNNATAGNATFTNNGGTVGLANGGATDFFDTATAGNGAITSNGGTASLATGGITNFFATSTAGGATVIANGATFTGAFGGQTLFNNSSAAGNATLIANGGVTGGGGSLQFLGASTGGTARVEVFGNGSMDISQHTGGLTIGSIEGSGNVFLGSRGLTVGANNLSTTFSGVIQDQGGNGAGTGGTLTKIGTGTLTLNGADTYTGATTVSGGMLQVDGSLASPTVTVNAGGALGGTGTINGTVINGAVVSPGDAPGVLTIKGGYSQTTAGTLVIGVGGLTPGLYDLLQVSGSASLAGKLQLQQLNGFQFRIGNTVTFLTAGGGVSGTFGTVSNPFNTGTMVNVNVVYLANSVLLEGVQGSFSALVNAAPSAIQGETRNQSAVAHTLDASISDPRQAALVNRLDNEPLDQVLRDLDRIAPEELTSIYQIAASQAKIQTVNLQRRLEDVRAGSSGFNSQRFSMNSTSGGFSGPLGDAGVAQNPDGKGSRMALTPAPNNRWGVFVTGTGEWVNVGGTDNSRGYDLTNAGFTLGLDFKATDHLVIGLAVGYDHSTADLTGNGRVTVDGGKVALYATYFTGSGFYTDFAVEGGYNSYDTHRAALAGSAIGSADGGELNVLFGTGYDWKVGGLTFGPTGNFEYTYLGVDSYGERGSLAPLNFPNQHQESIRSTFGAKVSYEWKIGSVVVKPELRAGWQHEYGDATFGFESSFANGAGPEFLVHGPATGRDSLLLSAGFAIQCSERCSAYVYYDGELGRANYEANGVSGGFRIDF